MITIVDNTHSVEEVKNQIETVWLPMIGAKVEKHQREFFKANYDTLHEKIAVKYGSRYAIVQRVRADGIGSSAYAFIDLLGGKVHGVHSNPGDIYKPATWRAPAKHARGNIFADDNGLDCCGVYGVAYLK